MDCPPGRHQQCPGGAVDTRLSPGVFPVAGLAFLSPSPDLELTSHRVAGLREGQLS